MIPRELDMDKPMEVVFTNGQYGLYEDLRYEPVEGLCMYQCREADDASYYIASIEEGVLVNFSGTIFTKEPLDPALKIIDWAWEGFTDDRPDDGWCGFSMSPNEFLNASYEELEKKDRRSEMQWQDKDM